MKVEGGKRRPQPALRAGVDGNRRLFTIIQDLTPITIVMRRVGRLSFLLLAWPGSRQGGNLDYEYFKVVAPLPAGARG